jgi:hypothetical protein
MSRALVYVALVLVAANIGEFCGFFVVTGPFAAGALSGMVAVPAWALWVLLAGLALESRDAFFRFFFGHFILLGERSVSDTIRRRYI